MLIPGARIRDTTPRRVHSPAGGRAPSRPAGRAVREVQRPRTSTDDEAALLHALPWGALVVDRHYDIQTINLAAQRLLGIHGSGLGEDLLHLTERLPAPGLRAAIDAVRGGAGERACVLCTAARHGRVEGPDSGRRG